MSNGNKILHAVLALATMMILAAPPVRAQQDDGIPKPAARQDVPLPGPFDVDPNTPPDTVLPDTRPLTGTQEFSVGTEPARHSYWAPGFRFANFWQSNPVGSGQNNGWASTSYVVGTLSARQNWIHSSLAVNYSGGGTFSTAPASTNLNGGYQQLGLVQEYDWNRWKLSFIDQFSYTTSSTFGFGGGTNIDLPGIGGTLGSDLPGLQNNYVPNQSAFGSIGTRYSNGGVVQTEYLISKRSSIVLSGSYGILRFTQSGNIDVNDAIFSAGYNYQITPKDQIGVVYHFSSYRYLGDPQAFSDHTAQFAYGRKLTGRLGLQLFGGPEITVFRIPMGNQTQRVGGAGGVGMAYSFSKGNAGVNYSHGLTGGSGLLVGSTSDQIQFQASRQLARGYSGQAGFGFSRNKSLESGTSLIPGQSFDTYYFNAGLNHTLGRTMNLNVGYTFQKQNSNLQVCPTTACGTTYTQHEVSIGFDWHTRPYVIE
jgi:hypothetical protein